MTEKTLVRAVLFTGDSTSELVEKPVPEPGIGEILLSVRAEGVCGSDLHYYHISQQAMEEHMQPRHWTTTPGHEIAGVVDAVGPGVAHVAVGDRVAVQHYSGCGYCYSCRTGWDNHCENNSIYSLDRDGGYQDKVIVTARDCVPLPPEMSFESGAFLACGASTAYQALQRADLRPGGRVAVVGLGPVGLAVLAWCDAFGFDAYGIDPIAERRTFAEELGYRAVDPAELATDLSLADVDAAIETSGNIHGRRSASQITKVWGTVVLVGFGPGYDIEPVPDVIMKQSSIRGSFVFSMPVMMDAVRDAARLKVALDPIVTVRCTIEEAPAAVAEFAHGGIGKTMITW